MTPITPPLADQLEAARAACYRDGYTAGGEQMLRDVRAGALAELLKECRDTERALSDHGKYRMADLMRRLLAALTSPSQET